MQDKIEGDYLPLFLIQEEDNLTYVIDNQIFGCQDLASPGYYGARKSLNLLSHLYNLVKDEFTFPKQFQKFFNNYQPTKIEEIFDLVIGGKGYYAGQYLDFSISKSKSQAIFDNFIYNDKPLDFAFSLPLEDSFLILINHLIYCRHSFLYFNHKNMAIDYKLPTSAPHHTDETYAELTEVIMFAKMSAEYLLKEIQTKKISPYNLHRLNGTFTIKFYKSIPIIQKYIVNIFESLLNNINGMHRNRVVMNFALLSSIDNFWFFADFPVLKEFNLKKRKILKQLYKAIKTPLPPYQSKSF